MTSRDLSANQRRGWDKNIDAYNWLLAEITRGKDDKESKKLKLDLYNTFTYLFLCEVGAMAPPKETLMEMYQGEKEDGLFGFLKALFKYCPDYMEE